MKKKIAALILTMSMALSIQGCAVFMAARQPGKKDVSLFKVGTSRSSLIAEFGAPTVTEERDGKKYEIFKFTQGYNTPSKVGRAFFHGAADVFTLGLWEVVGTPAEMVFDGQVMAYEVKYDTDNRIETVNAIVKESVKKPEAKNLSKEDAPKESK